MKVQAAPPPNQLAYLLVIPPAVYIHKIWSQAVTHSYANSLLNFLLLDPLSANLTVILSLVPGNLALSNISITFLQSSLFSILNTSNGGHLIHECSHEHTDTLGLPAETNPFAVARVISDDSGGDDPAIRFDQALQQLVLIRHTITLTTTLETRPLYLQYTVPSHHTP